VSNPAKRKGAAADVLDAIDALHQLDLTPDHWGRWWCAECERRWPCPTARLLHPEDGG
jgi:hypothetical protein